MGSRRRPCLLHRAREAAHLPSLPPLATSPCRKQVTLRKVIGKGKLGEAKGGVCISGKIWVGWGEGSAGMLTLSAALRWACWTPARLPAAGVHV